MLRYYYFSFLSIFLDLIFFSFDFSFLFLIFFDNEEVCDYMSHVT